MVGPNGAGKSTLFDLIAGTLKPTSGSVALPDRRLGLLPQEFRLPPRPTCAQFLSYVGWLQGVAASDRQGAIESALDEVDLLGLAETPIRELSGGMVKRLGIAQALVHDPSVLILDEPTAGLDPVQRIAIREVVAGLGRRRIVCVSTHLVEDVQAVASRVLGASALRLPPAWPAGITEPHAAVWPFLFEDSRPDGKDVLSARSLGWLLRLRRQAEKKV